MDNFKIQNKELWLQMLNVSEKELETVIENKERAYSIYKKAKSNGYRTIYCINSSDRLYTLQKRLQKLFFCNIFLPECVYGFRPNYSYIDFLIPHISNNKNQHYLRLDIKDFFDSISTEYIKNFFKYYIDDNTKDDDAKFIIDSIIKITTLNNKFVQGAVTSPSISNFAFRQIDIRISNYCKKLNICYSRYADDMLFSSTNKYIHSKHFIIAIKSIISDFNFFLNYRKTLKYDNTISLNGYVIGNDIHLSRNKMQYINKLLFTLSKSNFKGFKSNSQKYHIKNQLSGYRAFFIQIHKYVRNYDYKKFLENKILTIEKLIIKHFES